MTAILLIGLPVLFALGVPIAFGLGLATVFALLLILAGAAARRPRTRRPWGAIAIFLGPTGCMYVANASYLCTPYMVPWMHTQLGSSGSAGLGTAAALKVLMRKGKIPSEAINVIAYMPAISTATGSRRPSATSVAAPIWAVSKFPPRLNQSRTAVMPRR